MAVQFDKLKRVDQETKDVVTGFIKMIQTELDDDCIIPSLVVTKCILFYHLNEFFTVYGDHMCTSDDTRTRLFIWDPHISRETGYGNVIIKNKYKCIYVWNIKITNLGIYDAFIGIDASNKENINAGFYREKGHAYYAFSPSGLKTSHVEHRVFKEYGKKMKVGDIVRMEVNTNDKTMKVYLNGEDLGIAHENILFDEREYYLAVSFRSDQLYKRNSVLLLSFEIVKL